MTKRPKSEPDAEPKRLQLLADTARGVLELLLKSGMDPCEALLRAAQAVRTQEDSGRLVPASEYAYIAANGVGDMAATKRVKQPESRDRPRRFVPKGDRWHEIFGRGVMRRRVQLGLTVPEAVEKFGVSARQWYRIEHGKAEATAGKNAEHFSSLLNMSFMDLMTLGTPPERAMKVVG